MDPIESLLRAFFLFLILGIVASVNSYAQSSLTNGLMAYYPLNTAGSQTDIVGGYNLTLEDGTAASIPGVVGNAIQTSGGNNYLHSSTFPSSIVLTNLLTVSVWIKGTQSPWGDSSSIWGIGGVALEINGNLEMNTTTGDFNTGVPINTNVWTQVVVVQTVSQVMFYTNGVLACIYPGILPADSGPSAGLALSADNFGYPAPGSYDEFALWGRALSASEVAQLYVYGLMPPFSFSKNLTNQDVVVTSNTTFTVSVTNASPVSYQWYFNPSNFVSSSQAAAYAEIIGGFAYGAVVTNGGFGYGNIPSVTFIGGGGSGAAGYATVSNGMVSGITMVAAGSNYTTAPTVVIGGPNGLVYGQTNNSLTISNASSANSGTYFVVVTSGSNSITSSVVSLTLEYPAAISSQPLDTIANAHDNATFNVGVSGTAPFYYQWEFNGTNALNATGNTLTITNISPTNLGSYTVIVSNDFGSVTSSVANLYMYPYLASPFAGLDAYWGQTNSLTVGAWGSGPLSYQWYFNGVAIPSRTGSTLPLGAIQFTNAGLYSVIVSSAYGSVTNTPYEVIVNPADVTVQLNASVVIQGTVGYTYTIQSTTNLSNPNSWMVLTNLTLTQPLQYWTDISTDIRAQQQKYYRVIPGQ
jgi:hypothetical protein